MNNQSSIFSNNSIGLNSSSNTTSGGIFSSSSNTNFNSTTPGISMPSYSVTTDFENNSEIKLYSISAMPAYQQKSLEVIT